MRILYVARHGPHDNQDEEAIAYALTELGHEVYKYQEADAYKIDNHDSYDFALFHKFDNLHQIDHWPKDKIKCFWYFDLIEHNDFELQQRSESRKAWAEQAIRIFNVGFMTDGDWVAAHPDKLVHLMQGADERVIGIGVSNPGQYPAQRLLFTGTTIHGSKRVEFTNELKSKYGRQFYIVGDRSSKRVHGRQLANLMASIPIVIAPDSPITDLYCSNRIYQALGFGAFLLHPRTKMMEESFNDGEEVVFYNNRAHLHSLIRHYLQPTSIEYRTSIGHNGLERVKREHLYRHRCVTLINTIKERFKL